MLSVFDPVHDRLNALVRQYNVPEFAANDPVQFPRRFSSLPDIEIAAFLTSIISWGRRPMILRNAERLMQLMGNEPLYFVLNADIDAISDDNIHRTFFGRHLRYALRGLRRIYSKYGTLQQFATATAAPYAERPSWHLAASINALMNDENRKCACPLEGPSRCLPDKSESSALKRFNMMLRWLVRDDGIVDMGVWSAIRPPQLYIPLDVHSAATSRALGLLGRQQNDRRAAEELTEQLKVFDFIDPVRYDFALFGAGVSGEMLNA